MELKGGIREIRMAGLVIDSCKSVLGKWIEILMWYLVN